MLYKSLLISLLFFLASGLSYGQVDAGIDQEIICGDTVMIGTTGIGDGCYRWSPEEGLDDPESPTPLANPTETTTYTLEYIGPKFSSKSSDQVKVTVNDIKSFTAIPKKCCWKKGERITIDQFEIVTNPPNANTDHFTISPSIAPGLYSEILDRGLATGQQEIVISSNCSNGSNGSQGHVTTNITIVDEGYEISTTILPEVQLRDFLNKKLSLLKPCTPNISASGGLYSAFSYQCCSDGEECIKQIEKTTGALNLNAGVECQIPIPVFPFIQTVIGGATTMNISFNAFSKDCLGKRKECTNIQISGEYTGGVQIGALNDAVAAVALVVIPTVSFPEWEYCLPEKKVTPNGQGCWKIDVQGRVTFLSFFSSKVNIPLVPKRTF